MPLKTPTALALGLVVGAAFGVLFGALASVFRNGPELTTGVLESWWWFSLAGAAIMAGWARSYRYDVSASRSAESERPFRIP